MTDSNELKKKKKGKEVASGSSSESAGPQRPKMAIQRLYETCKDVFTNDEVAPSAEDIARIRSIFDHMTPADVGLSPRLPMLARQKNKPSRIIFFSVFECPIFWIHIICLPPPLSLSLRNYRGMTVFSKLLIGTMHMKSYDWPDALQHSSPELIRLHEQVKIDADFTAPCEISVLHPDEEGSLRFLTPKTACAVLQVYGYSYFHSEGSHDQFYSDLPCSSSSSEECAGSDEKPRFCFIKKDYKGPKVVEQ